MPGRLVPFEIAISKLSLDEGLQGGVQMMKTKLKSYYEKLADLQAKYDEIKQVHTFFSLSDLDPGISEKVKDISNHLDEISNIVAICEEWETNVGVVQVSFDQIDVSKLQELETLIECLKEKEEKTKNLSTLSFTVNFLQQCSAALKFSKVMQAMTKNARYYIYVLTRLSGKLLPFPTVLEAVRRGIFDDMKVAQIDVARLSDVC
eukprot:763418-Hanusia_phi.AAC.11